MKPSKRSRSLLVAASVVTCLACAGTGALWFRLGQRAAAVSVFLLGLSLGPCLFAYGLAPVRRKQSARRVVLAAGGLSIVAFSVLGSANIDLEGFFMLLFTVTAGAAIGHTLVTVIVGPMLFGRFLCGWGCWRAMVLELLPLGRRSPGRLRGVWRVLPFAGLAASAGGAAFSVFVLGHRAGGSPGSMQSGSINGILAGFAAYYAASIGLAFALRDRRAFCKYVCPSSVILRITSRVSLIKMGADASCCNDCGACSRVCPMDIDVARFVNAGRRVTSSECILCQACAHVCPEGALHLSAGFRHRREDALCRTCRPSADRNRGGLTTA